MGRVRIPVVGVTTSRDGTAANIMVKDQYFRNVHFDITKGPTGKVTVDMVKRSGIATKHSVTGILVSQPYGCAYWHNTSAFYFIYGTGSNSTLYRATAAIKTDLPTNSTVISWDEWDDGTNQYLLAMIDGLYYINSSDTVTKVSDADFPGTGWMCVLDGYVFVGRDNKIYNSDLNSVTSWPNPAQFVSVNAYADDLMHIMRHRNLIVAFGRYSIEFFYNAKIATGSPLARIESATLNIGLYNASKPQLINGKLYFVGTSHGVPKAYVLDGLSANPISTPSIERWLREVGNTTTRTFVDAGKEFFAIADVSTTKPWPVYDIQNGIWTLWEFGSSHPGYGGNTIAIGDTANKAGGFFQCQRPTGTTGGIGYFSTGSGADNGPGDTNQAITTVFQTDRLDFGNTHRKFMHSLELVGDKQSSTSNVAVSFYDDDFATASTARNMDMSQDRPRITRCGSFRRRSIKGSHTANTPLRIRWIEMDMDEGST